MKYRLAKTTDLEQLYSVMKDAGYIRAFFANKEFTEVAALLRDYIFASHKKTTVVVCEDNTTIIAYSMFAPYKDYKKPQMPEVPQFEKYAYSRGTGVLTSYRGKKIGLGIRIEADAVAKKIGFIGLITDIDATNGASIRNNEKAGYELIQVYEDSYRDSGKNLIYKKDFY